MARREKVRRAEREDPREGYGDESVRLTKEEFEFPELFVGRDTLRPGRKAILP